MSSRTVMHFLHSRGFFWNKQNILRLYNTTNSSRNSSTSTSRTSGEHPVTSSSSPSLGLDGFILCATTSAFSMIVLLSSFTPPTMLSSPTGPALEKSHFNRRRKEILESHQEEERTHEMQSDTSLLLPWPFSWSLRFFAKVQQLQHPTDILSSVFPGPVVTMCDLLYLDGAMEEEEGDQPSGHSEPERFFQCLEYHRSLLPDYYRRWVNVDTTDTATTPGSPAAAGDDGHGVNATSTNGNSSSVVSWPRNIPQANEIPALEMDLGFCLRTPSYRRQDLRHCQDTQFRIASYYVLICSSMEEKMKGFKAIKNLAHQGHPDAMCLYGIILAEGIVPGVDINPKQAVIWWRQCVDTHRHIHAKYELAVALYTGEGTMENPEMAVKLFYRAAHLGHPGAAYLLGECLLDGVGTERDRSNALDWLVTAAELGHQLARVRVMSVLNQEYEMLDTGGQQQQHQQTSSLLEEHSTIQQEEAQKWIGVNNENQEKTNTMVNIERRYSIGGGSQNPTISARRKTKVVESRDPLVVVPTTTATTTTPTTTTTTT